VRIRAALFAGFEHLGGFQVAQYATQSAITKSAFRNLQSAISNLQSAICSQHSTVCDLHSAVVLLVLCGRRQ
jgi:hypothetical protein